MTVIKGKNMRKGGAGRAAKRGSLRALFMTLLLLLGMALPGLGLGAGAQKTAVKTKAILPTWLCAGEEAPVLEEPKKNAAVLWTMAPEQPVRTERHLDQYYQITDADGRVGYVSKGAVRIMNAKDVTAGTMFKLPHVAAKVPRLPVEMILKTGTVTDAPASIFLAAEEREEDLPEGERVYVFSAYGAYAAVWHRGRLGYVLRRKLMLAGDERESAGEGQPGPAEAAPSEPGNEAREDAGNEARDEAEAPRPAEGSAISASPLLEEAFSMLEEGNPIALRYEKMTGRTVGTLFPAGVPYFWGGKEEKILLERWPAYTTRKQWQGTHDFYQKDSIYVYGLDCVGFVKMAFQRAGLPIEESLNDLGDRAHCRQGDHLFCSEANPFPEDWTELAKSLQPGDLLVLHHPGRHAMICIGTLRDYGYTEAQLPALAPYLDHPLMIHSGENPLAYQRFDCLTARTEDSRIAKALGSDGGVSLCLLGVPKEAAETEVTCHERTYACFDVEGACVTAFSFGNVKDYYVFRPHR